MPAEIPGIGLKKALARVNANTGLFRKMLLGFLEKFGGDSICVEGKPDQGAVFYSALPRISRGGSSELELMENLSCITGLGRTK